MQGKKFQCVGSTLTPKFWHRYDKYNDDSNSKASPYLIVKLIFVIVNLNLNIFVLVNVPAKCCLAQLKCSPFQFFLSRASKKILSTVHCSGQYFTFYTLPTDLHNNEQHSIYLHNIAHNFDSTRVHCIFALECSRCSVLHNIVSIQSFTHWPETEWYHPKLESDLQKQVLL